MRKLFITIKSIFIRKKNPYSSGAIRVTSYSGQSPQPLQRKSRAARLLQRLQTKSGPKNNTYASASSKNKKLIRTGSLIFGGSLLTLLLAVGFGDTLLTRFESVEYFQVSELKIVGNDLVPTKRIKNVAAIIPHQTSILTLDTDYIEEELYKIAWISEVTVKKNYPSTVEITVVENIPVAMIHESASEGSRLTYIDGDGMPFLSVSSGSVVDFPVITGLSEIDDKTLKEQAFRDTLVLLKKIRGNDPHLPAQSLSEIHVTKEGELVVYLVEYPFPIFFGNGNTKRKYARLVQVLKALYKKKKGAKELISRVEYIQMEYMQNKVLVAESGSG